MKINKTIFGEYDQKLSNVRLTVLYDSVAMAPGLQTGLGFSSNTNLLMISQSESACFKKDLTASARSIQNAVLYLYVCGCQLLFLLEI